MTFAKASDITCTVAGTHKVLFRGQGMSLSAAALQGFRELGFDWNPIRGSEYWAQNDINLSALTTISA